MSAYKEYKEKYEIAKEMYIEGKLSLTKISKQLGIDRGTLSKNLKEEGVLVINKQNDNRCNTSIFKVIDTEEKAYWLGLLYADGSVSQNTSHIELTLKIEDKNHVEKFREFTKHKNKVIEKNVMLDGKVFKNARLSFRCKKMKYDLIDKGCTPQKSLNLTFPTTDQVPSHLIRHFVRGYFDGDGSMTNTEKTYRMSINGTEQFLHSLCDVMGWEKNSIKQRDGNAYRWESRNTSTIPKMLCDMYDNSNIYLERKYNLYKQMI